MSKTPKTLPQLQEISKLPVPETDTLDDDIQKYMKVCEEKLGLVPNVIRAKALRQESLRTFISKYNQLMLSEDTGLSRLEREMIAVVVSCHNHCVYCITSHGQAVRELSEDPVFGDILMTNYRELNLSERHRAMLDFAWKMTSEPWHIGDEDREALYKVGFSYEDVYDITDTVAYFNYTNRMTHGLGMLPNENYFGMNRLPDTSVDETN
ncbi:MAG: alkylhydroperoxidase [Alphaproteobacteria bacterium]|nr:alkylhydroperoxidase [Alphaproteobacteria bacterium]PPR14586.1 MAG: hypothetical protein CFH42_00345 [Alphaproteobacteria bacterium MarineAlpha12_Bin1]